MPYKCCVVGCNTGKNPSKEELNDNDVESVAVFGFPDQEKNEDEWKAWVRFVNRKDFIVTKSSRICEKHFMKEHIRKGAQRNTLIRDLQPIPCIQKVAENTPPSILPTPPPPPRKPPTKRPLPNNPGEDQLLQFLSFDRIEKFEELDDPCCPEGFFLKNGEDYVVFYEHVANELGIPKVKGAIRVDQPMHVRLFLKENPVRKNNNTDSKLTLRGSLVYLANHIKNSQKENFLTELLRLQHLKAKGRPSYSADIIRFALGLRYTSKQAYEILLEEFPFPSLSLIQKLNASGEDAMKGVKLLLQKGEIDHDINLLGESQI